MSPVLEKAFPIAHAAGELTGLAATAYLTGGLAPTVTNARIISRLPMVSRMVIGRMAQTGATFGIKEFADEVARVIGGEDINVKKSINSKKSYLNINFLCLENS